MFRHPYPACLLVLALAALSIVAEQRIHADERFALFTDGLPDHLTFQATTCSAEMSVREMERGYYLFCGNTATKHSQFKKQWTKLLDGADALRPDPGTRWKKSPNGALAFEFWYWDYPAIVSFNEATGQVVFSFYTREPACLTDSPLEPVDGGKIYRRGYPGLTHPVRTVYVAPDHPLNDGYGLFDSNLIFRMIIDRTGTPTQICFLRAFPNSPAHKEKLLKAVKQWRFKPATLNGEPVDFYFTVFHWQSVERR